MQMYSPDSRVLTEKEIVRLLLTMYRMNQLGQSINQYAFPTMLLYFLSYKKLLLLHHLTTLSFVCCRVFRYTFIETIGGILNLDMTTALVLKTLILRP